MKDGFRNEKFKVEAWLSSGEEVELTKRGRVLGRIVPDNPHQSISWTDAFREAERIGEALTEQTGIRSADLLHIGIALALNAKEFLTFNVTQREVAISAGFKCNS